MFFNNIFAVGALASLAAAVPLIEHGHLHHHAKREVAWTTQVVEEFVTSITTVTVFGSAPTPGSNLQHGPEFGRPEGGRPRRTSHVFQTITVHPSPAPSVQTLPATLAAPSEPLAAPSQPPAASVPVAAPSSPSQPAAAPAPVPSAPAPAPQPSQPASPAPSSPPPSSGGGSFTGDITYYTPGLGSCGVTNSESDHIVALAHGMMEEALAGNPNPNANPLCGRSITITYGGQSVQATIEDTCGGCEGASLDLTPSLFSILSNDNLGLGRISGVSWSYN